MEKSQVRIKDIAKMAGVSVGTVDRVVNKRGNVSKQTQEKVEEVLKQINYSPNLIARSLGMAKTFKIAVIIPNPDLDPYWGISQTGIDKGIKEWNNHQIRIQTFSFDVKSNLSFLRATEEVLSQNVNAVLVAPIFRLESIAFFKKLQDLKIPYILFNANFPEVSPLCFIGQQLHQSGMVGAELLHFAVPEGGKIAVLHTYEDIQTSVHLMEKERGFRQYFKDLNDSKFEIVSLDIRIKEGDLSDHHLSAFLQDEKLRGIFITTSSGAYLTAEILEKLGRHNVKIVGYDLLSQNIEYLKSGKITFLINQNPMRQAFLGINHLANYLLFKKLPPELDFFPLEIVTLQNLPSYLGSRIH